MREKCTILGFIVFFATLAGFVSSPVSAAATSSCPGENIILTIPAWYRGLTKGDDDDCNVKSPSEVGGLGKFATIIALNIVDMLLNVVVYIAVGFIMYGGFQYILAQGSAQYIVSAKKTILNAIIGLIIAVVAISVVRFITGMFS